MTGQPVALAAYIAGGWAPSTAVLDDIRQHMKATLAPYAIPAHLVPLAVMPIQASTGKIDRKLLPDIAESHSLTHDRQPPHEPVGGDNGLIAMREVWRTVLRRDIDGDANFFDVGGHSLKAVELALEIARAFGIRIDVVDIFTHPTLAGLAAYVTSQHRRPAAGNPAVLPRPARTGRADIAVIAMACRFPGADSPEALWELIREGRESIRTLTDSDLRARGVPEALILDAQYVRRAAVLDRVDLFDPGYFGLSEREAVLMDPQHRLFLECTVEALSRAGRGRRSKQTANTGVWAGCYLPSYLVHHLGAARHLDPADPTTFHLAEIGNDKDYLPTRVAYLRGPRRPRHC
ncbi:MAG: polyketide synthase, partial [Sphingomonadales bacterium]|nr:polyketide synthase [Sphingomonadales bacterium]